MKTKGLMTVALAAAFAATLGGCYSKQLVLAAEVVSMTKTDAQSTKDLKGGDEINEKWCMGDEPALPGTGDDKQLGLADQVIYKAQKARKADFITDVRIYRDTDGCALLTGRPATL